MRGRADRVEGMNPDVQLSDPVIGESPAGTGTGSGSATGAPTRSSPSTSTGGPGSCCTSPDDGPHSMDLTPDGICVEPDGAVWTSTFGDGAEKDCVRVAEDGEILDRFPIDRDAFALMLGGRTLSVMAAVWDLLDAWGGRTGRVLTARAPAPGPGWPGTPVRPRRLGRSWNVCGCGRRSCADDAG